MTDEEPEDEFVTPQGEAAELYAREGTPCATCTCSFMTLRKGAGTTLGFESGGGLVLRVCRIGREPLVAEEGTDDLWCDDYKPFSDLVPLDGDDLTALQTDCTRGFLADLAQGVRPLPRTSQDLRWYDRGLREGWLPPHRIEEARLDRNDHLRGPWNQFKVVGVTPAFGDGHTPAVGRAILQAVDRRSYLLVDPDSPEVHGHAQPHGWWVNQVSTGAALPLESAIEARPGHRVLVLRGGERALSRHAYRYLPASELDAELERIADETLDAARSALKRRNPLVAGILARQGLRARSGHPGLTALLEELG